MIPPSLSRIVVQNHEKSILRRDSACKYAFTVNFIHDVQELLEIEEYPSVFLYILLRQVVCFVLFVTTPHIFQILCFLECFLGYYWKALQKDVHVGVVWVLDQWV